MDPESKPFKHFVYLASNILILRFDGTLGRQEQGSFTSLQEEIQKLDYSHLILNLKNVTQVDRPIYRFLVQLQSSVRKEKEGKVRVLSPPIHIKDKLTNEGILRADEFQKDLKCALESIS